MNVDNWLLCSLIYNCAMMLLNFALVAYFQYLVEYWSTKEKYVRSCLYLLLVVANLLFAFLHQSAAINIIKNPQKYIEEKGIKVIPYDEERML